MCLSRENIEKRGERGEKSKKNKKKQEKLVDKRENVIIYNAVRGRQNFKIQNPVLGDITKPRIPGMGRRRKKMEKIYNRKRYNTKTAQLIGLNWNGLSPSDASYWKAGLYRTKKGNFFLAGEGGPNTQWGYRVGNMWAGGSGIIPLSGEEALRWAERHLNVEEYKGPFEIAEA